MLEVSVDTKQIQVRLGAMGGRVRSSLEKQCYRTAIDLQKYIVQEKLSLPGTYITNPSDTLLHRVSGRLARSIQQRVISTFNFVGAKVFSAGDVPYAKVHEDGGSFTRYGRTAGDYTVSMPKRSYMKTSLAENKPKIIDDLKSAVKEGLHA